MKQKLNNPFEVISEQIGRQEKICSDSKRKEYALRLTKFSATFLLDADFSVVEKGLGSRRQYLFQNFSLSLGLWR